MVWLVCFDYPVGRFVACVVVVGMVVSERVGLLGQYWLFLGVSYPGGGCMGVGGGVGWVGEVNLLVVVEFVCPHVIIGG